MTESLRSELPASATSDSLQAAEQAFLTAARSLLVERLHFARNFGFSQFGGQRDLFRVLGYPTSITFTDYKSRFERGGIAKRIVSAAPKSMGWSEMEIVENDDPESVTPFETAYKDLSQRLGIGSVLKRADIQAGIGEYSVIYIGAKEKRSLGDSSILEREMSRLSGPDDIAYLRPLPQDLAQIVEYIGDASDDDVSDPRYGLPKYYQIDLSGSRRSITGMSSGPRGGVGSLRKVHWSRIIHVTHEPLDNEIFSPPELQAVWNYLCDLDKLAGGGSESAWKEAVNRTLFDLDKDIGPDGGSITSQAAVDPAAVEKFKEAKEKIKGDLEEMVNGLKQYVLTRGITPKTIPGKTVNFESNARVLFSLIAATMAMPQRKIFGSEAAHLSSTQDEEAWNDFKTLRRNDFGDPLVRQLVDRFIKYGALPEPAKKSSAGIWLYTPVWPTEQELSEKEKAGQVNTLALANRNQAAADGTVIVTNQEIRDMVYPELGPLEMTEEDEEVEIEIEEIDPAPTSIADPSEPEIMPPVEAN